MSSKKINILFINDDSNEIAGSEFSLLEILKTIDKSKFIPIVLCYSSGKLSSEVKKLNIPIIICSLGFFSRTSNPFSIMLQICRFICSVNKLQNILINNKIDIVHINKTLCAPPSIYAAKKTKIPCIWHVRTFPTNLKYMVKTLIKNCSAMIFVSKAVQKPYLTSYPYYSNKFNVFYDKVSPIEAVKTKGYLKSELQIPKNSPIIAMIAHLTPVKKHEDFLKSASKILNIIPKAIFVIIGGTLLKAPMANSSISNYREKLSNLHKKYSLEKKMFFLGQRYDLEKIFPDIDVIAITSQYETFGRVAIEAASAKTPIVAYKGGGIPELFNHPVEITFTEPGNIDELTQGIISLLEDKEKAKSQADNAYKRAKFFTTNHSTKQIEALYTNLTTKE